MKTLVVIQQKVANGTDIVLVNNNDHKDIKDRVHVTKGEDKTDALKAIITTKLPDWKRMFRFNDIVTPGSDF